MLLLLRIEEIEDIEGMCATHCHARDRLHNFKTLFIYKRKPSFVGNLKPKPTSITRFIRAVTVNKMSGAIITCMNYHVVRNQTNYVFK